MIDELSTIALHLRILGEARPKGTSCCNCSIYASPTPPPTSPRPHSTTCPCRSATTSSWPSSGRPARARPRCSTSWAGSTTTTRATSSSTASPPNEYKDRDWDAYRNNRIGFVFQSYNLIPHQTVLSNVELALTLSGVSRAERRERADRGPEEGGPGRPREQEAEPALRRPDAARGHRARPHQRPRDPAGRRAHRRPRLQDERPDHGPAHARSRTTAWSSWSRTTPSSPSSTPRAS